MPVYWWTRDKEMKINGIEYTERDLEAEKFTGWMVFKFICKCVGFFILAWITIVFLMVL